MDNSQPASNLEVAEMSNAVTVLLFAALKDAIGSDQITVQLTAVPVTVTEFLAQCGAQYPAIAPWLPHLRVAVNCAYADNSHTLAPGDEIALLPPVAGGVG